MEKQKNGRIQNDQNLELEIRNRGIKSRVFVGVNNVLHRIDEKFEAKGILYLTLRKILEFPVLLL